MKKFKFNLDSVLTIRRHHKNQAASTLVAAQKRRVQLSEHREMAIRMRAEVEDDLRNCYQTPSHAAEILRLQDALSYRRQQVQSVDEKLKDALNYEDECRETVINARQGEETILNLLEKEKERYRRELDKEDEIAVGEFVNARIHLTNAH